MSETYNIIKFYQDGRRRVIRRGLDLDQARKYCDDPELSSRTASKPKGCARDEAQIARWDEKNKHWFYGFMRSE